MYTVRTERYFTAHQFTMLPEDVPIYIVLEKIIAWHALHERDGTTILMENGANFDVAESSDTVIAAWQGTRA